MLKPLLNQPELVTYTRLAETCKSRSAKVFAKIRLADVLPIYNSGISTELFEFALQSHYDFVITDAQHRPLFAVEFDGPTHANATQKARDGLKNELSSRFSMPLLRIVAQDLFREEQRLDKLTERVESWFDERDKRLRGEREMTRPSCPICGDTMVEKTGTYGQFLSCVRYPLCKGSADVPRPPRSVVQQVLDNQPPIVRAKDADKGPGKANEAARSPGAGGPNGVAKRNSVAFTRLVIAGALVIAFFSVLVLGIGIILMRPTRDAAPGKSETAPVPAVGSKSPKKEGKSARRNDESATQAQRDFLASIIQRKGWSEAERDREIRKLLGYQRAYDDLSKNEASKLLSAWDDRKK